MSVINSGVCGNRVVSETDDTYSEKVIAACPMRKCRGTTDSNLKEEAVDTKNESENPESNMLPIKNTNIKIHGVWARLWQENLEGLLEKHPDVFQTLRDLVEGRTENIDPQHRHMLEEWNYLAKDGTPLPSVKAILPAIYRESPDGPCIVEPFEVKTQEVSTAVQRMDERREGRQRQGAGRLLRKLSGLDDDEGKGNTR